MVRFQVDVISMVGSMSRDFCADEDVVNGFLVFNGVR